MAKGDVSVVNTQSRAFSCNEFDGVDDYVEIPHNDRQLGANLSNGFTISAWINPKSISASKGRILDKSTDTLATAGFQFKTSTTNRIVFGLNNGTNAGSGTNSLYPDGTWKHVLVTISSTQLVNFYINGILTGTADQNLVQPISAITTTNAIRIGNRATATDNPFNGSLRSVKMWNRVLTTTEIAQDYAGIHNANGCIHFFKLGGDYADYGEAGATATNSGSVYQVIEDNVAVAVKAQLADVASGLSGAFMCYRGTGGEVNTIVSQVKA